MGLRIDSLENDGKTFTVISLQPKQVYENQLRLKKKGEVKNSKQSCKNVRKKETHESLKRIILAKIERNGNSTKK